jgi:acetylornithine deacetylase/succinyl-diaminopimelate desuccinylase-like protein
MADLQNVYRYIDDHADSMIADLQRIVRQPSISSTGAGVRECAELLVEMMTDLGIDARVMETAGLPVVFGQINEAGPDARTLVIYNHYDVQPADPASAWDSPPFEARIVGDRMIGRGTTDAKGNLMAHLKAIEALRATSGMPINVKFVFDGEEESSSPSLPGFVDANIDLLTADAALSFDGGFDAGDIPRVNLGSSGLLFIEMSARGGTHDLHSARARLVPNPAWKLVWALASMKGPDGHILIDGFLGGVTGVDALQQLLFTPTCNIAGFASGYVGEGHKTLLPSTATVNVDFRLVADQDPADILQKVRRHLDSHGFNDIEVRGESGIEPSRTSADSPFATVVVEAARQVYQREPTLRPTGDASGRQAVWLAGKLGIPGAGTAVGPPDWHGHAANEFMTLGHYINGVKYAATIWTLFAESSGA